MSKDYPKPVENGELWQEIYDTCSFSGVTNPNLTNKLYALLAQEKAKWGAEAEKLEHYYSHKARKEAGYAELYWCACGKYDKDKDRLLRHVRWHELALAKLLDKENTK